MKDFNVVWIYALHDILANGREVSPRGQLTKEIPQRTMVVDMRKPVLTIPERKLSYQFMAAEAYWILMGDDQVETIEPYNKNIAQFSDDGKTFYGAYGPKIADQLNYVIYQLAKDQDTRQAGLTIWRENPKPSKDIPCTVALFFNIREDEDGIKELNCHAFMRSSDIWLGIPYDVFNFSMLSYLICGYLEKSDGISAIPGTLYLTAASSHLYQRDFDRVNDLLKSYDLCSFHSPAAPTALFCEPAILMSTLKHLRTSVKGSQLRWWET